MNVITSTPRDVWQRIDAPYAWRLEGCEIGTLRHRDISFVGWLYLCSEPIARVAIDAISGEWQDVTVSIYPLPRYSDDGAWRMMALMHAHIQFAYAERLQRRYPRCDVSARARIAGPQRSIPDDPFKEAQR